MNEVTQAIADFISRETGLAPEELHRWIEVPRESQWGDYAFPCFPLAKALRKPPQNLAREVAVKFKPVGLLSNCTAAGAYINFRIQREAWAEVVLKRIFFRDTRYGQSSEGEGKRVLIEFSSPKIAKPFHVGNRPSTIIGNALCTILEARG